MEWKYLLGILGAICAWIWSTYTWLKSQQEKRAQEEYQRKEALYRELLRALNVFYRDGPRVGPATFLEHVRLAWLYAPDDVVRKVNAFLDTQKATASAEERDQLGQQTMAVAVVAIRNDLFKTARRTTDLAASEFRHYM